MPASANPSTAKVWTILGALYFVWGTTYLGIEKVNETMPTLLGAATRFLFAGAVLFAWTRVRTGERPRPVHWRTTAVVGTLLVMGGNGLVAVSENMGTPTGIVSLIIALIPIWLALFDRVILKSAPLGWRVVLGLVGGFVGAAVLIGSNAVGGHAPLGGMLVAVCASLCWTVGSLYARTAPYPRAPLLGSGMQQFVGGAVMLAVAISVGEIAELDVSSISRDSWLGLAWLIVAGSFVGFSAYLWLLRNVRTTLVATYAYVNPIVAVTLGWLVLSEPLSWRLLLSGAIVLASVAMIVSAGGTSRHATDEDPEAAAAGLPSDAGEQAGPQVEAEI